MRRDGHYRPDDGATIPAALRHREILMTDSDLCKQKIIPPESAEKILSALRKSCKKTISLHGSKTSDTTPNRFNMEERRKKLTIPLLLEETRRFCIENASIHRAELYGVTDGKAIGTFVEHLFKDFIASRFEDSVGNTASGIDIPAVNTDIKVTSMRQPQSSCPYKDSRQKIFGLGYNLLLFVYQKVDDDAAKTGVLDILHCVFIDKDRTADYQTTTGIRAIINNEGNADDIYSFLSDHRIPADEVTLYHMAEEILKNPPAIGYLTISNALQWRLQYGRVVAMGHEEEGITTIIRR